MDKNIAQKILDKELENIVKKIATAKTLTPSERLLIGKHYNKVGYSVSDVVVRYMTDACKQKTLMGKKQHYFLKKMSFLKCQIGNLRTLR